MIYRYYISIVDVSTLLKNINIDIDIDEDNLENIDINIDRAILENIDIAIDINKDNLENIDINKDYLGNIDMGTFLKIPISILISIRTFWVKENNFWQI